MLFPFCRCDQSIVSCAAGPTRPIQCRRYQGETTTQPPNSCKFELKDYLDGEVFYATDECNLCWCHKGKVTCVITKDCENIVARRRSLNGF